MNGSRTRAELLLHKAVWEMWDEFERSRALQCALFNVVGSLRWREVVWRRPDDPPPVCRCLEVGAVCDGFANRVVCDGLPSWSCGFPDAIVPGAIVVAEWGSSAWLWSYGLADRYEAGLTADTMRELLRALADAYMVQAKKEACGDREVSSGLRFHVRWARERGLCRQCQRPWEEGSCECGGWQRERVGNG